MPFAILAIMMKTKKMIVALLLVLLFVFVQTDSIAKGRSSGGTRSSGSSVYVKGYVRKDGTYVQPHRRSAPDGNPYNNWSFPGNTNPYTGKVAPGNPETYIENYYNKPSKTDFSTGVPESPPTLNDAQNLLTSPQKPILTPEERTRVDALMGLPGANAKVSSPFSQQELDEYYRLLRNNGSSHKESIETLQPILPPGYRPQHLDRNLIPEDSEDRGDRAIRLTQQALTLIGFSPGPIDGLYGPKIKAALMQFQKENDLVIDGIAGGETFRRLALKLFESLYNDDEAVRVAKDLLKIRSDRPIKR